MKVGATGFLLHLRLRVALRQWVRSELTKLDVLYVLGVSRLPCNEGAKDAADKISSSNHTNDDVIRQHRNFADGSRAQEHCYVFYRIIKIRGDNMSGSKIQNS